MTTIVESNAGTLTDQPGAANKPTSGEPKGRRHPVATGPVRYEMLEGFEVAFVPLSGKHGIGKEAKLYAQDWRWISERFGSHWILNVKPKDSKGRVVSGRAEALAGSKAVMIGQQNGETPLVSLGWIVADWDCPAFVDG